MIRAPRVTAQELIAAPISHSPRFAAAPTTSSRNARKSPCQSIRARPSRCRFCSPFCAKPASPWTSSSMVDWAGRRYAITPRRRGNHQRGRWPARRSLCDQRRRSLRPRLARRSRSCWHQALIPGIAHGIMSPLGALQPTADAIAARGDARPSERGASIVLRRAESRHGRAWYTDRRIEALHGVAGAACRDLQQHPGGVGAHRAPPDLLALPRVQPPLRLLRYPRDALCQTEPAAVPDRAHARMR